MNEYFFRVFLSHMCLSLSLGTPRCNWIRIICFQAMGLQYKSCFGGNAEIQLTSYVPSSKLLIVWLKGGRTLCNPSVWRKTEVPSGKKWKKCAKINFDKSRQFLEKVSEFHGFLKYQEIEMHWGKNMFVHLLEFISDSQLGAKWWTHPSSKLLLRTNFKINLIWL